MDGQTEIRGLRYYLVRQWILFDHNKRMSRYNDFLDPSLGCLLAYRSCEKRKFEFWWTKTIEYENSRKPPTIRNSKRSS